MLVIAGKKDEGFHYFSNLLLRFRDVTMAASSAFTRILATLNNYTRKFTVHHVIVENLSIRKTEIKIYNNHFELIEKCVSNS